MSQTSDSAQNGGASGTKVTSLSVKDTSVASPSPASKSGVSQDHSRGKDGKS